MFVPALLTCILLRAFSAQAKVDDDFDCKEFFFKDTEPEGMDQNAKKICQFTADFGPHYATLYSVNHRIPLYSAYRFDPTCFDDRGRPSFWHLEPQLSNTEEQNFMVRETERTKKAYKGNQAISDDYHETGYDRGHLNPNSFQCREGRIATSTLTNIAPMDACFNRNQWGNWEKNLRTFLRDKLVIDSATAYIVTGTVPDVNLRIPQSEISEEPERVTVPSHIWTAVCYKHHSDDRKSFSFGYMGENKPEGSISLMSVSNLNTQIKNLNRQLSEVSIFVDDCFHDNNKLDEVKVKFQTLISQQSKDKLGVQMSSGMQNTYLALRRAADSNIIPEKKFKVSEMTIKLAFDSMSTYYNEVKDLKVSAGSTCLITRVKPLVRSDLRKRDISGVSDAVECLLVPEKQMTAADGSPCSKFSDSRYSCQCETSGEIKSCCSTPCLYHDNLNSYRCYTGQTQIECSARYSLVTYKGEKCLDDHPCATYGYDYYWCKTISGGWDFCSPPLWRSKAKNGKYCRSDHACAKYGSGHMWCFTDDEGNYDDCCTSDDCNSAVNGQTCRSNHKCDYHGNDYLWCYTDYEDNWDYCCRSCW